MLAASLAFSPTTAGAIDAGDMDPHLPEIAILASMRFRSATRKIEEKAVWDQEHAKLLTLLNTELEKASLSDSRAATALRTLISDLKDAKYVPRKQAAVADDGEFPTLADGHRVMVKEDFHIKDAEVRAMTYPFEIRQVPATVRVAIGGGHDNSGDGGLHYMLVDPVGRVIKRGFSDKLGFVWVEHLSTRSGQWRLIIEDLDTRVNDKKRPGNRGAIEVLVKPE